MEELKKATQKKETIDSKKRNFPDSLIDDDENAGIFFEFTPDFTPTSSEKKPSFPDLFAPKNFKPTQIERNFEEHYPEKVSHKNPVETSELQVSYELECPKISFDSFEDDF